VHIRAEEPTDFEEIDDVLRAAFGQSDEVELVREIRASPHYVAELALVASQTTSS
jgi:predicted N-acetyltransferase YhbS